MRVLVVSDVHSNLAALQAVLADAGDFDALWSLGDIVGYGPQPNECIATLREHEHSHIAGNHDWGVLGKISLDDFNGDARKSNLWNREQLDEACLTYLQSAPETIEKAQVTLAHGSPRYPIWEYLIYASVAKASFGFFETPLCLVGHTHVPILFTLGPEGSECQASRFPVGEPFALGEGRRIVNPGSVGQPRDGDPRAAYLVLETDGMILEHRRVSYDIEATQRLMRKAGLPRRNITRLELGW